MLRNQSKAAIVPAMILAGLAILISGCEKSPPPEFRFNEVEWIKQERLQLGENEHFEPHYRQQVGNVVTALFGTPDHPKFPNQLGDPDDHVAPIEHLEMSAGAVKSNRDGDPVGLYREHCAHCHGVTGDGAGPTAAFLNPYPRDFRLGKFKFKSTRLRQAPTDEDMVNILRNGIPGTAMPSFRSLSVKEIESLIDYVKYLTIRGQFERRLIAEIGNLDGEPLLDVSTLDDKPAASEESDEDEEPSESRENFETMLYDIVSGFLNDESILDRWYEADDAVTAVPSPPENIELTHPDHHELISAGKILFGGKANCVQCHGETGLGDGQTDNYDDWVEDWKTTPGVNLLEPASYQEILSAGAMPPRPIRPRNLRMPVFRGGSHPDDIYRRIANGIEGTPMPSSPALTSDEIWALVAYVKSMPYEESGERAAEKPVNKQPIN